MTGAPAVPSRAGPRGHRLAGSKRPGGGGGAPRLDAAGRGCSPQPRGGRARQPRVSPPSSCPGAALELVSRFELTMRRCAKKPRDRARDPGRRGARGSIRGAAGDGLANATRVVPCVRGRALGSPEPRSDPRTSGPRRAGEVLCCSPPATGRADCGKAEMETRSGPHAPLSLLRELGLCLLYTSPSPRD